MSANGRKNCCLVRMQASGLHRAHALERRVASEMAIFHQLLSRNPGDRRDVSYKIAQSAEGATQPSPDREVGVQVGMKREPRSRGPRRALRALGWWRARHKLDDLIENIPGIKIHARVSSTKQQTRLQTISSCGGLPAGRCTESQWTHSMNSR
jgi:hypothetical protein